MVSAFTDTALGFGLKMAAEQLATVNANRRGTGTHRPTVGLQSLTLNVEQALLSDTSSVPCS